MIHPTAIVDPTAQIGQGTNIWAYAVIEPGVVIGKACVIGTHTFVGVHAVIGDRVRIMGQCYIPTQITIGHDVFIGPQAVFTGDKYPEVNKPGHIEDPVVIEDGVSVGAHATILPGVRLGNGCMIGAGAVVTHDVESGERVVGNPAHPMFVGNFGYV